MQHRNSVDKGSSPKISNHYLGLSGRIQDATSYHTSIRLFGSASLGRTPRITSNHISRRMFGTSVLTLLKVLKNA